MARSTPKSQPEYSVCDFGIAQAPTLPIRAGEIVQDGGAKNSRAIPSGSRKESPDP
jgi:hypothetical protein